MTCVWAAQTAKTESVVFTLLLYCAANTRDHIMVVLPNDPLVKRVSRRFKESVKGCKVIWERIKDEKRAMKTKEWNLGINTLHWASSESLTDVVSAPIRFIIFDEEDSMKPEKVTRAVQRTNSYGHKARHGHNGTPTHAENNLWQNFLNSDQSEWTVICEGCGERVQLYEWENVNWSPKRKEIAEARADLKLSGVPNRKQFAALVDAGHVDVWLKCPCCDQRYRSEHRRTLNESGEYVAKNPHSIAHRGFRMNALGSMFYSLEKAVAEYYRARGNPGAEAEFQNQVLALPSAEKQEIVEEAAVIQRIKRDLPRGMGPEWAGWLMLGVDVQADRCVWAVWAWDEARGHLVDHGEFFGDGQSSLEMKRALLKKSFPKQGGGECRIALDLTDSGAFTFNVYQHCVRFQQEGFKTLPVKGSGMKNGPPFTVSDKIVSTLGSVKLVGINVHAIKLEMLTLFKMKDAITFHAETDHAFANQYVSEALVSRINTKGYREAAFEMRPGYAQNHFLDASCYARAGFQFMWRGNSPAPVARTVSGAIPGPKKKRGWVTARNDRWRKR